MRALGRGAIALGLVGAACQLVAGIDDHHFTAPTTEGGTTVVRVPSPPCGLTPVQPKPTTAYPPTPNGSYVVALDTITLPSVTMPLGYDLDGVCTCEGAADKSAHPGQTSCALPQDPIVEAGCDFDGGVDDTFAALISQLHSISALTGADPFTNQGKDIRCGNEDGIMVLSDYNGGPEDDSVNLFATSSPGIYNYDGGAAPTDSECGDTRADGPSFTWPAKRDGTDLWSLPDPLFVEVAEGNSPPGISINTISGYVTNNQLVIDGRGSGFVIPFSFQGQIIHLSTPILTATTRVSGGKVYLDNGLLAGRLSSTEMLTAIQTILSSRLVDGGIDCNQTFTSLILPQLCRGRDIRSAPSDDFRMEDGGLLPCDAFSVGVGFTAIPTLIDTETHLPPQNGCPSIPDCPN